MSLFILLLLGGIVFSPLGSTITLNIFHLPISSPELLFIPFIPFIRRRYYFSTLQNKQTVALFLVWLSLIFLAIFINKYSFYAIISTARAYLYLLLFYLLFSRKNNVPSNDILFVALGSIIGWCFDAFFQLQNAIIEGSSPASYGTMLFIPIILGISILGRKPKYLFLSTALFLFLSFTAGVRRQIVVTIVSFVIIYFFVCIRDSKKIIKGLLILFTFTFALLTALPFIEERIIEISPLLHHRIFAKTEALLNGRSEQSGDDIREMSIKMLFDNISNYFIPHGYVSKQTSTDTNTGIYNDLPLLELFYTLSVPVVAIMILYFTYMACRCFIFYIRYNDVESSLYVITFLIVVMLLFLEGGFISYPYATPITGLCLGKLKYYSRIHLRINA